MDPNLHGLPTQVASPHAHCIDGFYSARGDHEHLVHISAFYMDKTEVTNLQYRNLSLSPVTQSLAF
ncbi:MAG TPA: hypothetical protein DIC52_06455 [Candidatus Latescibacteria bacterium]|nr:hypothetical protein [Candidatus Latescibacterota bacterium]